MDRCGLIFSVDLAMVDLTPLQVLRALPPDTLVYVLALAVILAPWVYRWRQRVRRILVRVSWIVLGVVLGVALV